MGKPSLKNWSALILSILLAALGIVGIATQRIGSPNTGESYASGNVATALGAAAIIIALIVFIGWNRKRRKRSSSTSR